MSKPPRNPAAPYMAEPWFELLRAADGRMKRQDIAKALNISGSAVTQILNGSGHYGSGRASTRRLAERVVHVLGRYECPHLTEQCGESRVISADECRAYAHRPAPIGSPRDLAHWRACNACPHKPLAAPPVPKPPRKRRKPGATENTPPAAAPAPAATAAPLTLEKTDEEQAAVS